MVDVDIYQFPNTLQISTSLLLLSLFTWYECLGHLNFPMLKTHLNQLNIKYKDNSHGYVCNSCLGAKATKIYNHQPQKRLDWPYQFVYTDLVSFINLIGFSSEKYFFIFTNDVIRKTKTYTGIKKSDWLKCLKTYHSLCRTKSKEPYPIKSLRSDYRLKLKSNKANKWM